MLNENRCKYFNYALKDCLLPNRLKRGQMCVSGLKKKLLRYLEHEVGCH